MNDIIMLHMKIGELEDRLKKLEGPKPKHSPCPFCGGIARLWPTPEGYRARCTQCQAETTFHCSEDNAWTAWDRRKS